MGRRFFRVVTIHAFADRQMDKRTGLSIVGQTAYGYTALHTTGPDLA